MTIIFVAGHAAATSNTNNASMPCRIDSFVEKHIAYVSYMLDKHKHMTKKGKKTEEKERNG